MWIIYAFGSALFAGITAILAKCGIKKTPSNVAAAVRTIVVLAFAWLMVFITGSQKELTSIDAKTWLFLLLSGIATGASWLCYFRALKLGDINKVVPIDKSSTVLTILLAVAFLGEELTALKAASLAAIALGTLLMIQKKPVAGEQAQKSRAWFLYAAASAVFAALTAILGKLGIENVESNLGTAIRTAIVLILAWVVVFVLGETRAVGKITHRELGFICLSGIATGASWLCYYKALKDGPASIVVPIDKLSILITISFSFIVFKERLTKKSSAGLALITAGTLAMLF